MKIVGILKQEVEIDASPLTLVKTLIKHYFNVEDYNNIVEKDGYLCYEYDISVHGSPVLEYKKITKDQKKIELFKTLIKLLDNIEAME